MITVKELTDEQKIKIFKTIFLKTHSVGFMLAEINCLLTEEWYYFCEPTNNWRKNLRNLLKEFDCEYPKHLDKIGKQIPTLDDLS